MPGYRRWGSTAAIDRVGADWRGLSTMPTDDDEAGESTPHVLVKVAVAALREWPS